jgi:hypothetical protein
MRAYTTGGIPDNAPITKRTALLMKPKEKSLHIMARASETGKAIIIEITTTRKVPHIAGSNPKRCLPEVYTPEKSVENKFFQPTWIIAGILLVARLITISKRIMKGIIARTSKIIFIQDIERGGRFMETIVPSSASLFNHFSYFTGEIGRYPASVMSCCPSSDFRKLTSSAVFNEAVSRVRRCIFRLRGYVPL